MQVPVRFRPRRQDDRTVDLPSGATAADLMQACGVSVDIFVAVVGGRPVVEDSVLEDGVEVLLLSAASGG